MRPLFFLRNVFSFQFIACTIVYFFVFNGSKRIKTISDEINFLLSVIKDCNIRIKVRKQKRHIFQLKLILKTTDR